MSPVNTNINIKAIIDYRNKSRPYRLPSMSESSSPVITTITNTSTTMRSSRPSVIAKHILFSSPPLFLFLDHTKNNRDLFRNSPAHNDDLLDFDKVINSQGNKTGLEL